MRWCDVFSGGGWVQSCMVMVKGLGSGVEGGRVCCLHRFVALCRFKKEKGAGGCFGIFSGAEKSPGTSWNLPTWLLTLHFVPGNSL